MRDEGRLDHTDWGRYDTRHVVFEPRHMTREQLMDGYCWLYWEAYGTTGALDRLERYWRRYGHRRSGLLENTLLGLRVRRLCGRGSPAFQAFLREGMRRLGRVRGAPADIGQLLYFFDSAHFGDYLRRYRSDRYDAHERIFRGEVAAPPADPQLVARQWERGRWRRSPFPMAS
jgi:hypothetical protein